MGICFVFWLFLSPGDSCLSVFQISGKAEEQCDGNWNLEQGAKPRTGQVARAGETPPPSVLHVIQVNRIFWSILYFTSLTLFGLKRNSLGLQTWLAYNTLEDFPQCHHSGCSFSCVKTVYRYYLPCFRPYAKNLSCIKSFNPHTSFLSQVTSTQMS